MFRLTSIFAGILLLCAPLVIQAQQDSSVRTTKGFSHAAAFEISIPIGAFSSSHIAGAGLEYSWSRHRYGQDVYPKKLLGLTVHAGGSYFLGKNQTVAANDFRFGGYTYLHALAGIIYNPFSDANVSLVAGPGMGIYKGNSEMGWVVKLAGNYYFREKISIGPAVMYRKHAGSESLWSLMIRAVYTFR